MSSEIMKVILSKVDMVNDCMIWNGLFTKNHPKINIGNKSFYVGKYVWNYYNPKDLIGDNHTCHRLCDNNHCVNIKHMLKKSKEGDIDHKQIWEKMMLNGERQQNDCLLWKLFSTNGYGIVSVKGCSIYAHRISYMIKMNITEIPSVGVDGVRLFVRHLCNNKLCFEPSHLELGTQYQNDYDDKISAGTIQRGERHYNSSITEEIARKIKLSKRNKDESGYKTQSQRAKDFNVSKDLVKSIDCGKSWANLPDRNGNTSSSRKIKARLLRKNAKEREWTVEMWDDAKKRLENKSTRSREINVHTGTCCINWNGLQDGHGYGRITVHGRNISTHILACSIKNKRHRLDTEVTRHLCGNKQCIREDHLEFGTHSENAVDTLQHGDGVINKLSSSDIQQIRGKYVSKKYTYNKLAIEYDVAVGTISNIIKRKTWKHIE